MRYYEHRRAFRNNSHSSKFSQHLIKHVHSFGTINDTTPVLHYQKKGSHPNIIERFYIHIEAASNNHLNGSHTIFRNRIFDTILKTYHPKFTPPFPSPYHIPLSINIPSVQHTAQHPYNETSLPQEIKTHTHTYTYTHIHTHTHTIALY